MMMNRFVLWRNYVLSSTRMISLFVQARKKNVFPRCFPCIPRLCPDFTAFYFAASMQIELVLVSSINANCRPPNDQYQPRPPPPRLLSLPLRPHHKETPAPTARLGENHFPRPVDKYLLFAPSAHGLGIRPGTRSAE